MFWATMLFSRWRCSLPLWLSSRPCFLRRCWHSLAVASLTLLEKPGSTDEHRKFRPLSVLEVVNNLVSEWIFDRMNQQDSSLLAPLQLDIGISCGCKLTYNG